MGWPSCFRPMRRSSSGWLDASPLVIAPKWEGSGTMADVQRAKSAPERCADGCCVDGMTGATSDAPRLRRWAWWLTALTIAWNSLEAVVAIISGLIAGSIALVGF